MSLAQCHLQIFGHKDVLTTICFLHIICWIHIHLELSFHIEGKHIKLLFYVKAADSEKLSPS